MGVEAQTGLHARNEREPSGSALSFVGYPGALARALSVCWLICLLGTALSSMRHVRHAGATARYEVDLEDANTNVSGVGPYLVIRVSDTKSAYQAILADDEDTRYGWPALTDDASRLIFAGGRIDSRGHLTDPGLYVAEVARDRRGRPQEAGPAIRAIPLPDVPLTGIILCWLDGDRVLYSAPIRNTASDLTIYHVFLADIGAGRVRDLTPPSLRRATNPVFSRPAGRIAFTGRTRENGMDRWDVYTIRPDGTGLLRLTHPANTDGPRNICPTWSEDGREVQFRGERFTYRIAADGTGQPQRVEHKTRRAFPS